MAGMNARHAFLCALIALTSLASAARAEWPKVWEWDFSKAKPEQWPGEIDPVAVLDRWDWAAEGDAKRRMPAKKVEEGRLILLESWSRSTAAASPKLPANDLAAGVTSYSELTFDLVMTTGTEGMGVALLDIAKHGQSGLPEPMKPADSLDPGANSMIEILPWGWEAPNFRGALGVGFDASNPVNRDPFRGSGNAYDRPQHEISLHWDGLEIVKKTTKTDFRDGKPHRVKITTRAHVGGTTVSVSVGDEQVFDSHFIPNAIAYRQRPTFGARNADTAGDVAIGNVTWQTWSTPATFPAPRRVMIFDKVLNNKDRHTNTTTVDFPLDTRSVERIIATIRLDKPETRFDPWDRLAHIWIDVPKDGAAPDAKPERFELLRYVTPYHRGWQWSVDVTDLRSLLQGKRVLTQECATYADGWLVSMWLDYYDSGPSPEQFVVPVVARPDPRDDWATTFVPSRTSNADPSEQRTGIRLSDFLPKRARSVIPLWQGSPEIGNPDKPIDQFYTPREVKIPDWVRAARIRMTVSGHGMSPNDQNAAEFMPIDRTLTLTSGSGQSQTFKDRFWKEDVYLNPCRPQGGTWKYDRAAWAPGDIVHPWIIDVPANLITPGGTLNVAYELAPYINAARGKASPPIHVTDAQLILYGDANSK